MSRSATTRITVTRTIDVPPATVYDAWLDPEIAAKFFFATPEGVMVRADIDPRVGGSFVMTDRRDSGDVEHGGEFLVLERPRQIVFRFGIPANSLERTQVSIELKPLGNGSQVTITHELSPGWSEYAEKIRQGWLKMLDQLQNAVRPSVTEAP